MKKISAILLILVMLFAFAACKSDDTAATDPTEPTGSYEIDWNNLPDDELVGAWQPADSESDSHLRWQQSGNSCTQCILPEWGWCCYLWKGGLCRSHP